jgi:hypothetical protein
MSSVLSGISQVPRSSSLFIAVTAGGGASRFFGEDQFVVGPLATGTVSGSQVFLTAEPGTSLVTGGFSILAAQTFKDLGKNYYFYAPNTASGVQVLYAVFTKVRRIGAADATANWEGDNGLVGYICTYSSAQTNAAGALSTLEPICVVARTGHGHGF